MSWTDENVGWQNINLSIREDVKIIRLRSLKSKSKTQSKDIKKFLLTFYCMEPKIERRCESISKLS